MISTLAWVPRGASKKNPSRYDISAEEMAYIRAQAENEEDLSEGDGDIDGLAAGGDDELPAEFKMDEYDNDAGIEDGLDEELVDEEDGIVSGMAVEGNMLQVDDEEESEGEADDYALRATDALVLVGHTEEDFSCLEVHVYEEKTGNLYVHHDIALPAFPLSLAWMDCAPHISEGGVGGATGSFVAVGTFKPGIEIWNLDVIDALTPVGVLGGEVDTSLRDVALQPEQKGGGGKKKKKKGKKGGAEMVAGSHRDAVMGLSWNRAHRNLLASGSADATVKVWDVSTQQCAHTLHHHNDKVQAVAWHPVEATMLASAGFDRQVAVVDARNPSGVARFGLGSDVESLHWDPHNPTLIVASTEAGQVTAFDVRRAGAGGSGGTVYDIGMHDKAVSALSFSPLVPGLLATCSVDETVKVWDQTALVAGSAPQDALVATKNLGAGELYSVGFYSSSPFLLGAGGAGGALAIWEADETEAVVGRFGGRVTSTGAGVGGVVAGEGEGEDTAAAGGEEEDGMTVEATTDLLSGVTLEAGGETTGGGGAAAKKKNKKKKKKIQKK